MAYQSVADLESAEEDELDGVIEKLELVPPEVRRFKKAITLAREIQDELDEAEQEAADKARAASGPDVADGSNDEKGLLGKLAGSFSRRLKEKALPVLLQKHGLGRLEAALEKVVAAKDSNAKVIDAVRAGTLDREPRDNLIDRAAAQGIINGEGLKRLEAAEAARGDVIQVEAGTYSESIDFLGKTISVTSVSGSSNTIIDGGGTGVVVSFITGETLKSLLDGFTLQFGSGLRGAGVYISSASPTIKNCLIKNNQATLSGGAMYVIAGNVELENIVFEGNVAGDAGGAVYLRESSATITGGSMLSNSSTNGGAMYVKDCTGIVSMTGVTIRQNSAAGNGEGIYVKNSEVIATDCIFDLNNANDGGAWFSYYGGDATITNGVFNDNSALGLGGAANIRSNSTVSFLQCTFESNVSDSDCDFTL